MDKKINFLHTCREAAAEAEKLFGMNARIILAQGALESGWGTSMLATEHHNFFGLMGYGASNAYWHGQRATFETAYGTHHFRHYEATHLSFLDFARLIRSAYPRAYHFSFQPEAYAKEIAYSPYISEQNGDNRDLYRRNIIALRKRRIILVDHNEATQAVEGFDQAEILEIIDHHRIGSLETSGPVYFRNQPVGCGRPVYRRGWPPAADRRSGAGSRRRSRRTSG